MKTVAGLCASIATQICNYSKPAPLLHELLRIQWYDLLLQKIVSAMKYGYIHVIDYVINYCSISDKSIYKRGVYMQRSNPSNDKKTDKKKDMKLTDEYRSKIWFEDPYHYLTFKRSDDSIFSSADLTGDFIINKTLGLPGPDEDSTEQASVIPRFCNIL